MPIVQEQQFIAFLSVAGPNGMVPVPGTWDGVEGGDTVSEARTYRAGGMVDPEALPAPPETEDITIERAYRGERDGALRKRLVREIGYECGVAVQALMPDKTPDPDTHESITGVIKSVTRPTFRSEGDSVTTYQVVITPRGHWS